MFADEQVPATAAAVGRDLLETARAFADVMKRLPVLIAEHEDAVRFAIRRRLEQHRVDDADDRGRRADAYRQGRERRERKRRRAAQRADRHPEIVPHAIHGALRAVGRLAASDGCQASPVSLQPLTSS